jgi:hypothetical protein
MPHIWSISITQLSLEVFLLFSCNPLLSYLPNYLLSSPVLWSLLINTKTDKDFGLMQNTSATELYFLVRLQNCSLPEASSTKGLKPTHKLRPSSHTNQKNTIFSLRLPVRQLLVVSSLMFRLCIRGCFLEIQRFCWFNKDAFDLFSSLVIGVQTLSPQSNATINQMQKDDQSVNYRSHDV